MTKRSVVVTVSVTVGAAVLVGAGIEWYVRRAASRVGGATQPAGTAWQSGRAPGFLAKELGLSKEQAARVGNLEKEYQRSLVTLRNTMATDRIALCGLVMNGSWERKAIGRTAARIAAGQARQQALVMEHLREVRLELTPGQRARFADLVTDELCAACRAEGASSACVCPVKGGHRCGHQG